MLFATHSAYLEHLAGPRHPERPERARRRARRRASSRSSATPFRHARAACRRTCRSGARASGQWYSGADGERCAAAGGGRLDPDTYASPASFHAASLAARCRPDGGRGAAGRPWRRRVSVPSALLATTPSATESMGFCMISNVASRRARWPTRARRVMILRLRRSPRQRHAGRVLRRSACAVRQLPPVAAVSRHWQRRRDRRRAGAGTTLNILLPAGTTGDVYLRAFDEIVRRSPNDSRRRGSSCPPASTRTATIR